MIIIGYLVQIFIFLLVAYFAYKAYRKAEARGAILEKKADLELKRELYKTVEPEISSENVKSINRAQKGLNKFNSL